MQIKTTMRYHLPPIKIAIPKKQNSVTQEVKLEPLCVAGGNVKWGG